MVCPHAQDIRGAVAYCRLARRKVSTLRFPCKGNYRACPIYVRLAHIAPPREFQVQEQEEAPRPGAAPQPAEPTATQPQTQPTTVEQARPKEAAEERPAKREVEWGSGEAICDSLILALLISAASTLDIYRGDHQGLTKRLAELDTDPQSFLLLVGSLNGVTLRAAYKDYKVFSIMTEVGGETLCGGRALEKLKPIEKKSFDLVIYRVKWDSLGAWREYLAKELRKNQ